MVKKIIMGILSMVFIMAMGESVHAETLTASGSTAEVPVTYTVSGGEIIVTIPALIVPDTEETNFEVMARSMNLRPDQYVEVNITAGCDENGAVTLERQNVPDGKPVATLSTVFSVGGQSINKNNYLVGSFEDGTDSTINLLGPVSVSALNVDKNTEAGDYKGLVEFTVTIKRR